MAFALLCLLIAPHDAAAQTNTPGAPTIDKVTARAGWLLVEWSAPSSNGGSDITAYDIRRIETDATDKADSNWDVTDDIWTTVDVELRYALRNLANGTEYDVQVCAVDSFGDGEWSETTKATPADFGDSTTAATVLTLETTSSGALHPLGSNQYWGKIESSSDADYFRIGLTETQVPTSTSVGFWLYTIGQLDTVGELIDSNSEIIESDDYGAVLPDPENFFMWQSLSAGTYYLKVEGWQLFTI